MTIPGVDAIAAMSIVAAIGEFHRFPDAHKLEAYVGLNPRVRQSGNSAPVHGRISKAGRAQVRGVLVEAAWSASRAPGPLRAFFQRIKARRGFPTAIVATARKMTVLAWHLVTKDQDYAFARPGLVAPQTTQTRTERRSPVSTRQLRQSRCGLQRQATTPGRTCRGRASRTRLHNPGRALAAQGSLALLQNGGLLATLKAKPFGWPAASLDRARGTADRLGGEEPGLTISSVVQISVRMAGSNARKGTNSAHAFCQSRIIAGYFFSHLPENSAKRSSAAASVGAW
jgi:hypothetical protein